MNKELEKRIDERHTIQPNTTVQWLEHVACVRNCVALLFVAVRNWIRLNEDGRDEWIELFAIRLRTPSKVREVSLTWRSCSKRDRAKVTENANQSKIAQKLLSQFALSAL